MPRKQKDILWPTDRVRDTFLDFFRSKGHKVVPSDSLIPRGDPTLLFTGAGMNQFKEYFLGMKKDLRRVASSQKCLRTGDLDNVGKTPYHHSFFEMLGNFSFGDYFKREAVEWAMELLVESYGISRDRLRVSVHQDDEEAYSLWRERMRVPARWIKKLGDHTNFWPADAIQQGPNGPCGPCSEIYYDQGEDFGCRRPECDVDCECGRFAEIWNLVFTQFDRQEGGKVVPLATRNIDTGMGLERLACVLQGKRGNFEIDILEPLVGNLLRGAGGGQVQIDPEKLRAARTIVDHGRAATFAIGDGAIPSNEGRGYVVRKLIRRAIWQGRKFLFADRDPQPFLYRLPHEVAKVMGSAYPSLERELQHVEVTLRGEEERFLATLEDGEGILEEMIRSIQRSGGARVIPAEDAFKLYDTYGFPDELTVSIAKSQGLEVDLDGFQRLMEDQRRRAKEASKMADAIFAVGDSNEKLVGLLQTTFLGYTTLEAEGRVLWTELKGPEGWVVLDQTPFYAEQGGQVGDVGIFSWSGGAARVLDTQWKEKWILHRVQLKEGALSPGQKVRAQVDENLRERTRRHHTATHLLQAALRKILGSHVRQLGSLVSPEKLRFDFSHPKSLTDNEIKEIEKFVNSAILANLDVKTEVMSFDESQQTGALSFFGEKYEERVRVLNVGEGLSKELCGGTHVKRTGDIGSFFITSESSIGSGTRRIEAVAGLAAIEYLQQTKAQLGKLAATLKTSPAELVDRVEKLRQKAKTRETESQARVPREEIERWVQEVMILSGLRVVCQKFAGLDAGAIREAVDEVRAKLKQESVIVLSSEREGMLNFAVGSQSARLDAGVLARRIAGLLEGSGGGKKEFAQGGTHKTKLWTLVEKELPRLVEEMVSATRAS